MNANTRKGDGKNASTGYIGFDDGCVISTYKFFRE
jgi:hypothetical protein